MEYKVTKNQRTMLLIGISIASFIGCIDFTIINTALPAIQSSLHASMGNLQWVINIFILALSSFMVIAGKVADVHGRRIVLYVGMIVFGISSLLAGLSPTIHWLILWRFVQGVSCTILYTATGAIVSNAYQVDERGKAMGTLFGVNALGLAIGPVLGGIIVGALSWRWVFLVNIPLIILSLIICIPNVRESRDTHGSKNIDYFGALLLILCLSALVLSFTQANTFGWTSFVTIGFFVGALLLFIIFYMFENRTQEPIIKFDLFLNPNFISSIMGMFSLAFFYCVAFFLMPLYLHNVRGESDYQVGFMLLPVTFTIALISPWVGRYADRRGAKAPLLVGFMFFAVSAIMQYNFGVADSIWFVLIAFVFMGLGWGFILGPSTVLSLASLPDSKAAIGMGASWTMHNVGGVVGLGIGLAIYNAKSGLTNYSFIHGYQRAMLLLIAITILTFLLLARNFIKSVMQPKV